MAEKRYVWLLTNSYTRWLWRALGEYLRERTGLEPVLVIYHEQDRKFYANQFGRPADCAFVQLDSPYEFVLNGGNTSQSAADIRTQAEALEERFGITLLRDMMLPDQHFCLPYMVLGSGHPRSPVVERITLDLGYQACIRQFECVERFMDQYPPGLVLSYYGGGGLQGKPIALLCRERGVPFRALCPARFGNLMYWADDEFEGCGGLRACLSQPAPTMSDDEIADITLSLRPTGLATNPQALKAVRNLQRLPHILRTSAEMILRRLYGRLRNYYFARIGYSLSSSIAQLFRARRHGRLLDRIAVRTVPQMNGVKLVYYPLQQEPEVSTFQISPDHFNQYATIIELSLSLPADARLCVKEHIWQAGRRPNGFYEALTKLHNVILVHPEASSLDLIRRSSLVCVITSSVGHEAAALGKPVITFWNRSPIGALPHVHVAPGFADMGLVRRLLAHDDADARRRRENDGAVFLKRLREFCMDLDPLNIHGRQNKPSDAELDIIGLPLLTELGYPVPGASASARRVVGA
jgi:hypothetical protein